MSSKLNKREGDNTHEYRKRGRNHTCLLRLLTVLSLSIGFYSKIYIILVPIGVNKYNNAEGSRRYAREDKGKGEVSFLTQGSEGY